MARGHLLHRRTFLVALAGGAAASLRGIASGHPQSSPAQRWPAVHKLLGEWIAARTIAGGVVALSFDREPFTYLTAGRIALDSPIAIDENSLCRIHSMTKTITGVAVMMLVERGKLDLDQPVIGIIPEWRRLHVAVDSTKSLASRPTRKTVTVRHLLTHTSGLGDWAPSAGAGPLTISYRERGITPGNRGTRLKRPGHGPQARDLVEMTKRVAELPLAREPGAAFLYSTIGYAILGLVIERISGNTLDVYFRERIFEPLQMTSTGFQVRRHQRSRLTTNYDVTPTGLMVTDAAESSAWLARPTLLDGGGGLISTARDFARFSTMLLNDGTLDGTQVLRPDTARRARSNLLPPGITVPPRSGHPHEAGYGAGMSVALTDQGKRFRAAGTVSHGGASGTVWIADPTHRATMVFMAQYMPPSRAAASDLATAIEADRG